jgi:hypothetical protein
MIMKSTYTYTVHGLVIASEFELPELPSIATGLGSAPDVVVRLATLPLNLETTATEIPDLV